MQYLFTIKNSIRYMLLIVTCLTYTFVNRNYGSRCSRLVDVVLVNTASVLVSTASAEQVSGAVFCHCIGRCCADAVFSHTLCSLIVNLNAIHLASFKRFDFGVDWCNIHR